MQARLPSDVEYLFALFYAEMPTARVINDRAQPI